MSSYRSLVDKFNKTKRELGDAEKSIRRLTGRDPDEIVSISGPGKFRRTSTSAPSRGAYIPRKRPSFIAGKRPRERESSFEDTEEDDEEEEEEEDDESPNKKPALQSTVVAKKLHDRRSRRATIEEQNANSKIKARNRRMFGALIGTLEKFKHEEKKRQHKEMMRAEVEQKVEAATEEERERIKKEKEVLFITRREKYTELRSLEKKIERAESHEVYEKNQSHLKNFIKTKSKPQIFFLPSSHTTETRKCLDESRSKTEELIRKRKEKLEADLAEIDIWYKKDSLPGDKENKCPKGESESQDVPETESETLVVEQEDTGPDNSNSDSDAPAGGDDDSNNPKTIGSLTDQDFEPIYD